MTSHLRHLRVFLIRLGILAAILGPADSAVAQQSEGGLDPWQDLVLSEVAAKGGAVFPDQHRALVLDADRLKAGLMVVPMESDDLEPDAPEGANGAKGEQPLLMLPLPDGTMASFRVEKSRVMADELMTRYPEIATYRGVAIEHPTVEARFELTPHGFHGMILGLGETLYINPMSELPGYDKASGDRYVAFARRHTVKDPQRPALDCGLHRWEEEMARNGGATTGLVEDLPLNKAELTSANKMTGGVLRTYRTAIATTGEYTRFHGGTTVSGLSAVVTAVNRLNAVLRRELSLRLVLVGRNDELIYTSPATDPYTNSDLIAMLNENQSNLDSVLGNGSYDLGHVFGTNGGGVAALRSSCSFLRKAVGASSLRMPVGDPFVVTYVGHEMGHQFGANHIFNGSTGACGANRASSAAYEPGSGSTIMSYAGICGGENLQSLSDDYYNTHNFDEMVAHVHQGAGRCGNTSGGAGTPTVFAGPSHTIPRRTPFTLRGSGNANTYAWEQHDLGPPGPPNTDSGGRPIFRSLNPVSSAQRTLPRLNHVLLGVERFGESLPTTSRNLTFRLTGRNNQGGVAHGEVVLRVAGGSGPFEVLAPSGETAWTAGETETVLWEVAGTDQAPVSCSAVDILFSSDGGNNFSTVLAEGVPNTGSQTITAPDAIGSASRVKIACSDNIFFAVSDGGNFAVRGESSCTPDEATLCLDDGRFKVTIDWRDFADVQGLGRLVDGGTSSDSGLFYFFEADNWEMLVKVINGCSFNNHYWVFAAATTNIEYNLRVVDTQTGAVFNSTNPLGMPSAALTDTGAFATCP